MDQRLISPAAERNLPPLIEALAPALPGTGTVLELASGPGQHVTTLARRFPDLLWRPSERDPDKLASIAAWRAEAALENVLEPLEIDLGTTDWSRTVPDRPAAALVVNLTHVAPWSVTKGLFGGLSTLLQPQAAVFLYGPFFEEGVSPASSNVSFDQSLRMQNPDWGLRLVEDLDRLAIGLGFVPEPRQAMPSNNLVLSYRLTAS